MNDTQADPTKEAGVPDTGPFSRGHSGEIFDCVGSLSRADFDTLLQWASDRKVSDITIQSDQEVICDIGGELIKVTRQKLRHPNIEELVRYIYGDNGPAELKRGYDLDPPHEIRVEDGSQKIRSWQRLRYRINATTIRIPGADGIQITIRALPSAPIKLSTLGVEQDIIDHIRPSQGMILVTGPTGSGKSTLLSSMIRSIVERKGANEKVLEYSAPIEYVYDEVDMPDSIVAQTEAGRHLRLRNRGDGSDDHHGGVFAYCVRNALRRKPTIIVIGESRDRETISASTEAALTGHLLFSTVHTLGVPETLRRMIIPFPMDERRGMSVDIMESMRMIVTQTLVPRKGGGKAALREYMVFDVDARRAFLKMDAEEWPALARTMMDSGQTVAQRLVVSARRLLDAGEITEQTFDYVTAREIS